MILKPNPYKDLPWDELPGGMARQVMEDLRREAPTDDGVEEGED